ncbi:hydrogen gas-evolving membrane-bound hydrogenase subunit E [Sorangium sp. So ce513]|uniref:hydrogen gas-evolving membrane-bound hydrogenase subunit E n=1 Tax=Sorangium sp. So ce513 TaxID=3133315 RepID=UPI003F6071F2
MPTQRCAERVASAPHGSLAMRVLPWIPFIPFALAAVVLPLPSRWAGRVALLAPASVLVLALPLWRFAAAGGSSRLSFPWLPSLGINADLRLDHPGAFFVLLIGAIGLAIAQYARRYLKEKGNGRFWAVLLAFMGSMLGLVLSDSLVLLYVFWELTTVTSALLIGMDIEDAAARRGAVQAFLVTGGGGLAMLAGVILLGRLAGTTNLSELEARGPELVSDPAHALPLALLLVGAFTKSAQFPFHAWLPGAMAAPAPVSAYLHSATLVKAGVFLLGRLAPIFSASPLWVPALTAVGLTTFVVAGVQAARAWDLKQLLAYSTAAYLGLLTALHGLHAGTAARGALVALASHALYKSALFLLVGWLEKTTGTRDLRVLRRARWCRGEPAGCALVGLGALALAGAPLLLGFVAKEIFYGAVLDQPRLGAALPLAAALAVAGSALSVAYALALLACAFPEQAAPPPPGGAPRRPRAASRWLLVAPALLLAPQLAGGLAPALVVAAIEPAAAAAIPPGVAIWHRADALLALGLAGYALGLAGGYLVWRRLAASPGAPPAEGAPLPAGGALDALVQAALAGAHRVSRAVQAGGHPRYAAVTLLVATAALAVPLTLPARARGAAAGVAALLPALPVAWLPVAMVVAGAVLTLRVRERVTKVLMMAIAGYGTALLYVLFRAPDLALTQILVETVSLLLLLLAFRHLPAPRGDDRPPARRRAHAAVALASAAGASALAWAAGVYPAPDPAGAAQIALAVPEAGGRNVVNVILVDLRGADTLGEIAVLAIAALGAAALFWHCERRPPPGEAPCDR